MWKNEKNSSEKTKVLKSVLVSQDFFVNQKYIEMLKLVFCNFLCFGKKLPMFFRKGKQLFPET